MKWQEMDGSKLSVFGSTFQMLRDLVLIRLCYLFNFWVVEGPLDGLPAGSSVWRRSRDDRRVRRHA